MSTQGIKITSTDPIVFEVSDEKLEKTLKDAIESADCDMLATFAGLLFGGTCFYDVDNDTYIFQAKPEEYSGAFGYPAEIEG